MVDIMGLSLLLIVSLTIAVLLVFAGTALLTYHDRRQLKVLARRLEAEQRLEAVTRATLRAMRDAAREGQR